MLHANCTKGIDCGAVRKPSYRMAYPPPEPAPTKLDANCAYYYHDVLRQFWGVEIEPNPPGMYNGERALFHSPAAWWHRVGWMPKLQPGWRRPSYREFLEIYCIPPSID